MKDPTWGFPEIPFSYDGIKTTVTWAELLAGIKVNGLPVCFGTPSNFRRETLTFEVVGFRGTYHAVLGRSCYAKFMAIPNYTYLKLKMSGPNGVITVGPTYKHDRQPEIHAHLGHQHR